MRTTLTLTDDIYKVAKNLAASKHVAMGEIVSELVRRGLRQAESFGDESGFPVFNVSEAARPFGTEEVNESEDEE